MRVSQNIIETRGGVLEMPSSSSEWSIVVSDDADDDIQVCMFFILIWDICHRTWWKSSSSLNPSLIIITCFVKGIDGTMIEKYII